MTNADFTSWVEFHRVCTGAGVEAVETLIANRPIFDDPWRTNLTELKLVTQSLVAHGRIPNWPNEHLKLVGTELLFLRESHRRDLPKPAATDCPLCSGFGLVPVPMPRCVWDGRLVTYMRDEVDYGYVATCFVTCDDCPAGREARNLEQRRIADASEAEKRKRGRMPTMAEYTRNIGGADGVALLREHNEWLARQSRPKGMSDEQRAREFAAMYPGLAKRAGIGAPEMEESTP